MRLKRLTGSDPLLMACANKHKQTAITFFLAPASKEPEKPSATEESSISQHVSLSQAAVESSSLRHPVCIESAACDAANAFSAEPTRPSPFLSQGISFSIAVDVHSEDLVGGFNKQIELLPAEKCPPGLDCSVVDHYYGSCSVQRSNIEKDFLEPPRISEESTCIITYQRRGKRKNPKAGIENMASGIGDGSQTDEDTVPHKTLFSEQHTLKEHGILSSLSSIASCKKTWSNSIGPKKLCCPKRICGQYFLDLGQSDFSYSTCRTCGLFYARGHENDEKLHASFHKNHLQGIQFKGWRNERVAFKYDEKGDRIILVLPSDPPHHQYKVREVAAIMEKELGLAPGWLLHSQCKVYFFISFKKVVGCIVAETIKEAYPILPGRQEVGDAVSTNVACFVEDIQGEKIKVGTLGSSSISEPATNSGLCSGEGSLGWEQAEPEGCHLKGENGTAKLKQEAFAERGNRFDSKIMVFGNVKFEREVCKRRSVCESHRDVQDLGRAIVCSKMPVRAVCGVRGMWVSLAERRRGIATKLLDAMRRTFFYGFVLEPCQCAFSQPTPDGQAFAGKYCKTESFLVYR